MDAISSIIFLMLASVVAFASAIYWRHLLFAGAIVLHIPIIIEYIFLYWYMRIVARINKRFLEQHRWTIWLKRQTSAQKRLAFLGRDLTDSIKEFITGKNMIVLQKIGSKVSYTPKDQRDLPEGEQTIFYFEKIERADITASRDRIAGFSDEGRVDRIQNASVAYELTLRQFCGWSGVTDDKGSEVPFNTKLKAQLYDQLPIGLQDELESEFGGGVQNREEKEADENPVEVDEAA